MKLFEQMDLEGERRYRRADQSTPNEWYLFQQCKQMGFIVC
jgi:hypothetical protein